MIFRPNRKYAPLLVVFSALFLMIGLGIGLFFGYDIGMRKKVTVNTFKDCVEAGYPVMESYPEQCITPDGKHFVNDAAILPVPDGNTGCTLEAKICPDGSSVGRVGPNCEFAPCPGE